MMEKILADYLKKHDIQYIQHEHEAVFTVKESDKLKEFIPGLRTKSLFLKDPKNNQLYLVCLPAEKRLDIKKLKERFNATKLEFASPEEMQKELRVSPGNASLFCMVHAQHTILVIDREVWSAEIACFHPNVNTATLQLTHANVEKFYNALVAEKYILQL